MGTKISPGQVSTFNVSYLLIAVRLISQLFPTKLVLLRPTGAGCDTRFLVVN